MVRPALTGRTSPAGPQQIKTTASGHRVKFIKPMDRIDRPKIRIAVTFIYEALRDTLRVSYLSGLPFSPERWLNLPAAGTN